MEKANVLKAIKQLKESSAKRNFSQTIDLIITLKNIDLKKTDEHIDFYAQTPFLRGKKVKVCGLVGGELNEQAKKEFDKAIVTDEFAAAAKDKKALKKLASEYDFFVAQGNIMAQVATHFGKVLGPRGKMPNPKAGCVVPPNANLTALNERLQKLVHISVKTQPMVQIALGKDSMPDEEVADNLVSIYKSMMAHLKAESNNIRRIFIKLTMSKPLEIDLRGNIVQKQHTSQKQEDGSTTTTEGTGTAG